MKYAIILVGGVGSRFWPLSRRSQPKQFLRICSSKSLLAETLARAARVADKKNIYLAANKSQEGEIKKCLRGLAIEPRNVFFEPQAKNTLAPIAFLAHKIYSRDKDALIAVFPCDHFIKGASSFKAALSRAFSIARYGYILTMGVKPIRPETGYGYIRAAEKIRIPGGGVFYRVERFIEKPSFARARNFIKDPKYYWNSGMFIFKAEVMLQEIRRLAPATAKRIAAISGKKGLAAVWSRLPAVSIDYAIMEKTSRAAVLPAGYQWSDLGSWLSLTEILPGDKKGNVFYGNCFDIGSANSLVWSAGRLVATLGLENIIVVDSPDAVLVCHKNKGQEVKKLVQSFRRGRLKKYL